MHRALEKFTYTMYIVIKNVKVILILSITQPSIGGNDMKEGNMMILLQTSYINIKTSTHSYIQNTHDYIVLILSLVIEIQKSTKQVIESQQSS